MLEVVLAMVTVSCWSPCGRIVVCCRTHDFSFWWLAVTFPGRPSLEMVLAVMDLEFGDDWFWCATGNYFGVDITKTETTLCSHSTGALSSPGEEHEPRTGA